MNVSAYRKALVAFATALAMLGFVLPDGVTNLEWIQVALAGLGALGVYAVPNTRTNDQP